MALLSLVNTPLDVYVEYAVRRASRHYFTSAADKALASAGISYTDFMEAYRAGAARFGEKLFQDRLPSADIPSFMYPTVVPIPGTVRHIDFACPGLFVSALLSDSWDDLNNEIVKDPTQIYKPGFFNKFFMLSVENNGSTADLSARLALETYSYVEVVTESEYGICEFCVTPELLAAGINANVFKGEGMVTLVVSSLPLAGSGFRSMSFDTIVGSGRIPEIAAEVYPEGGSRFVVATLPRLFAEQISSEYVTEVLPDRLVNHEFRDGIIASALHLAAVADTIDFKQFFDVSEKIFKTRERNEGS